MEPNEFRESRLAINEMCEEINDLTEKKDIDASKECFQKVSTQLDDLKSQAEGEIQERSVKNLSIKVDALSSQLKKLKSKKTASGRTARSGSDSPVVWDQERVSALPAGFLQKVCDNMGEDQAASVCFSTTGKGVRPSYRIEFGGQNQKPVSYSGSSHSPLKRSLPAGSTKISAPFSYKDINTFLNR